MQSLSAIYDKDPHHGIKGSTTPTTCHGCQPEDGFMPSPRQTKGTAGEDLAAKYLEGKGYVVLERNYRFMKAEVDLIAFLPASDYTRGGDLVFVEVKWRQSGQFAAPEAAVDASKRRNMIMAAEAFLHERKLEGTPCRFDVVAIQGSGRDLEIEHLESAFIA